MKHWILSLLVASLCLNSACIFSEDDPPKSTPKKDMTIKMDMSDDMQGDMSSDMPLDMPEDVGPDLIEPDATEDMAVCVLEADAPANMKCCGEATEPINTDTNSEHCGACDNACGVGNFCDGGQCSCDSGAKPRIIKRGLDGDIIVDLLPFFGTERIKPCDEECQKAANGFEDIFINDPKLLHYALVHRKVGSNRLTVTGLDGAGKAIPGIEKTLALTTQTNRTIENIEYWSSVDGLYMMVHFNNQSTTEPRSELRLYGVGRDNTNNFKLINPQGTPAGGTNQQGLFGEILGFGTQTADDGFATAVLFKEDYTKTTGVLIAGLDISTADGEKKIQLPAVAIPTTMLPPTGTKLTVGFEPQTGGVIITWWSPSTQGGTGQTQDGSFYAMLYRVEQDTAIKVTPTPIKINDASKPQGQPEHPRSLPLGESSADKAWQLFQLKRQTDITQVQAIFVNATSPPNLPAGYNPLTIASPTTAFSPSIGRHYYEGLSYRELSWVNNEKDEPHGQIIYASAGQGIPQPKPISSKHGYVSVRQAFGLPGTMGYVGVFKNPQQPEAMSELHFFMTNKNGLVCELGPQTP